MFCNENPVRQKHMYAESNPELANTFLYFKQHKCFPHHSFAECLKHSGSCMMQEKDRKRNKTKDKQTHKIRKDKQERDLEKTYVTTANFLLLRLLFPSSSQPPSLPSSASVINLPSRHPSSHLKQPPQPAGPSSAPSPKRQR